MTLDQFWKIAIIFALLAVVIFHCPGCISTPSQICSTYGGIKRESTNFIYCIDGTVYHKKDQYYLDKSGEW